MPVMQEVNINEPVSILATTNGEARTLKFKWFKVNKASSEEELVDNPTARTSSLVFEKFELRHAGVYKCQVSTRGSNSQVVSRNSELVAVLSQCKANTFHPVTGDAWLVVENYVSVALSYYGFFYVEKGGLG